VYSSALSQKVSYSGALSQKSLVLWRLKPKSLVLWRLKPESLVLRHLKTKSPSPWHFKPNAQNEPPEAISGHISGQGSKILKMSILRPLLANSAPGSAKKCSSEGGLGRVGPKSPWGGRGGRGRGWGGGVGRGMGGGRACSERMLEVTPTSGWKTGGHKTF